MSAWAALSSRRQASRPSAPPPPAHPEPGAAPGGSSDIVILGPHDRLVGELYVEGDLRIHGAVEGDVTVAGAVEVGEAAEVRASIEGADVSIRGHVNGPVTARRSLLLAASGSLTGDVRVPRLVIQDGAIFTGNISMHDVDESATHPSRTPARVRRPRATSDDGKPARALPKRKQLRHRP